MEVSVIGMGGYKEIIFMIMGSGVYFKFKYENGVYCVQCVFEIELGGCIYIFIVIVVCFFEVEEVEVDIYEKDICVDMFVLSGLGG